LIQVFGLWISVRALFLKSVPKSDIKNPKSEGCMPIFEYRCLDCKKKVSVFFRSMSAVDHNQARCPICGGAHLARLVSRVRAIRSEESHLDGLADDTALAGLDENDPQSMGRWMRKMASAAGEEMPPEFNEVVGRLESGENPESIEKSMPEMAEGMGGEDF
jgi:putative FmdB family regulatory protein